MKSLEHLQRVILTLVAAIFVLGVSPGWAVDEAGDPFELDGDAVDNKGLDDWESVVNGTSGAQTTSATPIVDGLNVSIFTQGGSKDIRDITQWRWTDGSVPDKDEILNAIAAAYACPDGSDPDSNPDLCIYFAADRYSNDGDAQIGFWFTQLEVGPVAGGRFSGAHLQNDVLVLTTFEGGGKNPIVQVLSWDTSCSKADGPDKNLVAGNCGGPNLRIQLKEEAKCEGNSDKACAINNLGGETSIWPFSPKPNISIGANKYPEVTFFEGGINISEVFGRSLCFASFLAETRSSASPSAQLKDFAGGSFPLCKVELSKVCDANAVYDPITNTIPIDYTVTVLNDGFATVNDVVITDDNCGYGAPDVAQVGPIAPGLENAATYDGTCVLSLSDAAGAAEILNTVTAVAEGGDIPVTLSDTCITNGDGETCGALCGIDTNPMLEITKNCVVKLDTVGGMVKVRVDYNGMVTNASLPSDPAPTPLTDVMVREKLPQPSGDLLLTKADGTSGTSVDLAPGESAYFSGSYYPTQGPVSECADDANFTDTVEASAKDAITGQVLPPEMASANCEVCPDGGCQTLPPQPIP